jgi:hypothetical protein
MLRLLAQREEGYDDIAALMGLSVDEVRAKVKDALEGLDDSSAPPKPVEPPKAVEPPKPPPKPDRPAPPAPPEETQKPQGAPPVAKSPKAAPSPSAGTGGGPARRSKSPRGSGPRLKLPTDRGARIAILAGAAVVVLLVVLLATGAFGGEDSGSGDTSSTATANRVSDTPIDTKRVTGAILRPVDGGDAFGRAVLGRAGREPLLQIEAEGLEPSPEGSSYTVWLYKSPKLVLRAGAVRVSDENGGGLAAQFPIPVEVLQYIAAGAFDQIYLSLTSDAAYKAEVAAAKREKRLPAYTGTTVLRGDIVGPLMNASNRQGG